MVGGDFDTVNKVVLESSKALTALHSKMITIVVLMALFVTCCYWVHACVHRWLRSVWSFVAMIFHHHRQKDATEAKEDVGCIELDYVQCAVCLGHVSSREKFSLLPKCNHVFHGECIDAWLEYSSTCPLCRTPIDPLPLHRHHHHQRRHILRSYFIPLVQYLGKRIENWLDSRLSLAFCENFNYFFEF